MRCRWRFSAGGVAVVDLIQHLTTLTQINSWGLLQWITLNASLLSHAQANSRLNLPRWRAWSSVGFSGFIREMMLRAKDPLQTVCGSVSNSKPYLLYHHVVHVDEARMRTTTTTWMSADESVRDRRDVVLYSLKSPSTPPQ